MSVALKGIQTKMVNFASASKVAIQAKPMRSISAGSLAVAVISATVAGALFATGAGEVAMIVGIVAAAFAATSATFAGLQVRQNSKNALLEKQAVELKAANEKTAANTAAAAVAARRTNIMKAAAAVAVVAALVGVAYNMSGSVSELAGMCPVNALNETLGFCPANFTA